MLTDYSPLARVPLAASDKPRSAHLYADTLCSIRPTSTSLLDAPCYLVDWAGRQVYKSSYSEAKAFAERVTEIRRTEGLERAVEFFYTA